MNNSAVSIFRFRHPQASEGHRCDSPSVEPRFRGGAQRLGMRAAPSNLRGRAFHALSLTDGARCRVKPRPAPGVFAFSVSWADLGASLSSQINPLWQFVNVCEQKTGKIRARFNVFRAGILKFVNFVSQETNLVHKLRQALWQTAICSNGLYPFVETLPPTVRFLKFQHSFERGAISHRSAQEPSVNSIVFGFYERFVDALRDVVDFPYFGRGGKCFYDIVDSFANAHGNFICRCASQIGYSRDDKNDAAKTGLTNSRQMRNLSIFWVHACQGESRITRAAAFVRTIVGKLAHGR